MQLSQGINNQNSKLIPIPKMVNKFFQISHIVVLARSKTKDLEYYECYSINDIRKDLLPVKIFFNWIDFTHKLTLRSRLTYSSLRYIMTHYETTSFVRIAQHFRSLLSAKLMEEKYLKVKSNKKPRRLGAFHQALSSFSERSGPVTGPPLPQQRKTFVPSTAVRRQEEKPDFKAVPFNYGTSELLAKEARLKKIFGRSFLVYIQILSNKLKESNSSLPNIYVDFDHSVFSFLFENDFDDETEFINTMNSLLDKSRYPKYDDLKMFFHTMSKLRKITFASLVAGKPLSVESQTDLLIDALLNYFTSKSMTVEDDDDKSRSSIVKSESLVAKRSQIYL